MASKGNSESTAPPTKGATEHYRRWSDLAFDVARLSAYHGSEAAFYGSLGKVAFILSALSSASAVVTILAHFQPAAVALTVLAGAIAAANQVIDSKEKARFHLTLKSKFDHWFSEIERRRFDEKWVEKTRKELEAIAEENSYTVYWAVDALAWNSALFRVRPDLSNDPDQLIPVLTYEKLMSHIFRFSEPRFRKRDGDANLSLRQRLTFGLVALLTSAVLLAVVVLAWAWDTLAKSPAIYIVTPIVVFASLFSLDWGCQHLSVAYRKYVHGTHQNVPPPTT